LHQLCSLSCAHCRDLKLDNLLLVTPGNISNIKIVDFGFARKEHAGSAGRLNNMQTVCGTPGYIAPEVIRGIMQPSGDPVKEGCEDPNHHYGPPCDLWSAGIVLYMLLSGMPPFYDKSEPRLLRSIISGKFSFKDPVWEPVSGEAKDLIRKLLVVDPAQRLTCEQVLEHPWMQGSGGAEHLPRTAARIQDAITRRRSSSRLTLQQRISEAIDASRSVTPTVSRTVTPATDALKAAAAAASLVGGSPRAGGSPPAGGSPRYDAAAYSQPLHAASSSSQAAGGEA
jgi:calcium/calmodulin-dependent protein kinase I